MRRFVLLVALTFLISGTLVAQSVATAPAAPQPRPIIRDQDALNAVQAAIAALGGATAIGQVQSWQAQGQGQATAPDGTAVSGSVTWEMSGAEFRLASVTNLGSQAIVTGHGKPAVVLNGSSSNVPAYGINATFIPALVGKMLLQEFQNANCQLRSAMPETVAQQSRTVVKTVCLKVPNSALTEQKWYFDKVSKLPTRVEFRIPSVGNPKLSTAGAVDLSSYRSVGGVLYPFQISSYMGKKQVDEVNLQSLNINPSIASSEFDAPVGGVQ